MADTYWDHPARRETKRLLDLADVGAILDELQNQTTEWDDAREALDHLVRGSRPEVERVRAELADTVGEARSDIAGLESLARRYRTAWESARRGRREARAQVKAARPYIDWLHEQRRTLFTERDRLAEQVKQLRAERTRAVDALSDVGRTAEATSGDLEDGINAELLTARAEAERLRAELAAIRTTETDVTWLADGVRRLILGVSVRTAKDPEGAQYTIAQEVASHINAGVLASFVSSRVVDLAVEHIKKAEAERDRLAEELRKAAAYLYRRADLDADLSPSESRALATELRDATALGGTEAGR